MLTAGEVRPETPDPVEIIDRYEFILKTPDPPDVPGIDEMPDLESVYDEQGSEIFPFGMDHSLFEVGSLPEKSTPFESCEQIAKIPQISALRKTDSRVVTMVEFIDFGSHDETEQHSLGDILRSPEIPDQVASEKGLGGDR